MEITPNESTFLSTDITSMSPRVMDAGNVTNSSNFNIKIAYLSIGLLGMFGNFVVICVITRSPTLRRKSTNILILNQSLIDFCAAFFVIAYAMLRNFPGSADRITKDIFCRLWFSSLFMWSLFVSSTYNLVVLTLDRYVALVHPIVHRNRCSRKILYIIMAIIWFFGLYQASYIIPLSGVMESGERCKIGGYPSPEIQRFVGVLEFTLQYFIPLFIFTFAYARIALVLRHGLRTTGDNGVHGRSDRREERMLEASRKVFKTLLTVSVSFVVCWSPNQILYVMFNFGVRVDFESTLYYVSIILAVLNCCVNPIIYSLRYEEFQRELLRQVRCWNSASSESSSGTSRQPQPGKCSERKTDTTSDYRG